MKKAFMIALSALIILSFANSYSVSFGQANAPKMKGICVHGEDIYQDGAKTVLTTIKNYGYNTVFFLVKNPQGEVYYNSSFIPVKYPVLKETITEAHKLGLKIYVYFPLFMDKHYGTLHKNELMVRADGKTNNYYISLLSDNYFQYIKLFLGEILRYNIDGVVFDYIRFPNGSYDFSPYFEKLAEQSGISFSYVKDISYKTFVYPADWKTMFNLYNKDAQITKWVNLRESIIKNEANILKEYIKNINPDTKVGAFIVARGFGNGSDIKKTYAYQMVNFSQGNSTFSNLDFVIPMVYLNSLKATPEYAISAAKTLKEKNSTVYIGINPYQISAEKINREIMYAYAFGDGAVLFRYPLFKMGKIAIKGNLSAGNIIECTFTISGAPPETKYIKISELPFVPSSGNAIFISNYFAYKKIILTIGDRTILTEDLPEKTLSESQMDVAPFIKNNRTFVPIRFVAENLGFNVQWDGEKREVKITNNTKCVTLTIGEKTILKNGTESQMDVAPFIKNNRTFVPIRFVAENLGFNVQWDGEKREVKITGFTRLDN